MAALDPMTNRPLPDSAIQRLLFICPSVHIYQIPPITSTKGFSAGLWTSPTQPTAQQIFTARIRILETSLSSKIKADILLEDPSSGQLFAGAPYTSPAVVQQANDSSRFFAVRVQGEGGMKATLGIGFEDRSQAFDFGIALTDCRKVLGMDGATAGGDPRGRATQLSKKMEADQKKDFSLKEGEKIHIQVGSRGRRAPPVANDGASDSGDSAALFSIAPPPAAAAKSENTIPPPPSQLGGMSAQDLGFDDGEFGEFQ